MKTNNRICLLTLLEPEKKKMCKEPESDESRPLLKASDQGDEPSTCESISSESSRKMSKDSCPFEIDSEKKNDESDKLGLTQRNGDWVCLCCGNHNFSFRQLCNRCINQDKQLNYFQCFQILQEKCMNPAMIITKELNRRIELNLKFAEQLFQPSCFPQNPGEFESAPNRKVSCGKFGAESTAAIDSTNEVKSTNIFLNDSERENRENRRRLQMTNKENYHNPDQVEHEKNDFHYVNEKKEKKKTGIFRTLASKIKTNKKRLKKAKSFTPKFKPQTRRNTACKKPKNLMDLLDYHPEKIQVPNSEDTLDGILKQISKNLTDSDYSIENRKMQTKVTCNEDEYLEQQGQRILAMICDEEDEASLVAHNSQKRVKKLDAK